MKNNILIVSTTETIKQKDAEIDRYKLQNAKLKIEIKNLIEKYENMKKRILGVLSEK